SRSLCRCVMESSGGSERAHGPQLEKKRLNRAPSPARPFIKDVHSRSTKSSLVPKSPKLTKQSPAVPLAHPSRNSRRTATAAKDKPPAAKTAPRTPAKKSPKACPKPEPTSPVLLAVQKVKHAHGSPIRVPTGADNVRVAAAAGSSSDLSDCSAPESGTGSSDRDNPQARAPAAGTGASVALRAEPPGARSMPQPQPNKVPVAPKEAPEEELLREIEDLRSENDYLKDEVDELRAEMEEIRDNYLEEEVYQVQELRRELDRSNKNCRILQYRLRKAEQKSLRVAQTGHVDGELLRTLEQDLKVAKDVSVRLHNELEAVEEKRSRAEDENEALRQKIIEVEISKQALTNELDRTKEMAQRRRGGRDSFKDKKSTNQEDSADLRCQLQFVKEESSLMRKKMAKLSREKDELEQELQKYKSVYGDVDSPLPLAECSGGGPHSTREAELRLRLKLVEEEANILGRKIVELEVENRSLRSENEDIRCQYERDCFGREPFSSMPSSPYGGDALESASELRRHLQFVEEEAELLRRSISEIEDHNRQLTSELNRFKFGPSGSSTIGEESSEAGLFKSGNGSSLIMEELKSARIQINELSGKVMKLQYENRVLLSNVQRYDLAANTGTPNRLMREERESFNNVKREADRLGKTVDRLITDTDSLVYEGRLVVTTGEATDASSSSTSKPDTQVLDTINTRMKAFRTELHIFMERLEHVGEAFRDRTDDLSPMPNLTESTTFGRDLGTDFQVRFVKRKGLSWLLLLYKTNFKMLGQCWPQERAALHQELRLFRRNTIILYMKLRATLAQWRSRHREEPAEGATQPEVRQHSGDYVISVCICLLFEEREADTDTDQAFKQEREEHKRLLSESHSATLDLRWKLQHGEKRWSREKSELMDQFERERQEWDSSMREMHRKMDRVRHRIMVNNRCSVCSMSDFQRLMDSSPFLPDKDRHSDRGPDDVTPPLSPDDLKYIEEFNSKGWDFPSALASSASAAPNYPREAGHGAGAVGVEHYGYLHSPTRASQGNGRGSSLGDDVFSAGRWQCSGLRTPPNQSICPPVGFPSPLELQLSRNLSDDMKEVAISVRNAIRSPPGPILRDMSCQTNGFTTRGTQTTQTISVGLQTDLLRNLTSSPHRCLTPKGGGTPISSPSRNTRKVQYSPVIQSKFERPCCSPKYGSPKLQRKPSSSSKTDIANSSTRAPTPTTPQKGNSESAWARSTTTRDSPVHTTINDGLSSLFNIIDHTPVSFDPMQKFNKSPSRSRPSEPSPVHEHRTQQDTSRTTRGRSPSPVQLIVETHGDRNSEVVSIRQDLSAPPGYTLAENAARIVSKKLQESCREERRLQGGQSGQRDSGNRMSDSDRQPGCMEDLPRSPVAPPLDSCFHRPARPANRRPPSRWARSPSSSPRWSTGTHMQFTFPPAGRQQAIVEPQETV
uniref:Uncharacterized protein n=1 Tax=Periophthalmus magnuspinnatus TaxID=409849 RepID=A0A3B3ZC80_9GOBI